MQGSRSVGRLLVLVLIAGGALAGAASPAAAQSADALGAPSSESASPAAAPTVIAPPPAQPATVVVVPAPPGAYGGIVAAPATPLASPLAMRDSRAASRRGGYMPSWELLAPGLGAFVSTYGGALYAAMTIDLSFGGTDDVTGWLYAPVIGPFVLAANSDPEGAALFTVLGVVQGAGLGFLIAGLAINRRAGQDDAALSIAPMLAPGEAGLVAAGRF